MASSTWPAGSPRTVDDNQFEILGAAWSSDGIVGSPTDNVVVFADSTGLQVKIRANRYGVVHGHGWSSGITDIVKTLAANSSGQPRIDTVVLGLDRSTMLVTEYVKQGTPAANPIPPALLRDPPGTGVGKFEVPLAHVTVASGAGTISFGDVHLVSPWVGSGILIMPDVASLNEIWTPIPGTVAVVGPDMYVYTAANGWRRADWNASWGLIGGKEYIGNGLVTAQGIPGNGPQEFLLNQDSGPVTLMTGRRYEVKAHFRHNHDTNGAIAVFLLRENSGIGNVRGVDVQGPLSNAPVYETTFSGEWSETSGSTRTFLLCGYNIGGTMNVFRGNLETNRGYVEVIDKGPYGSLTGPV